MLEVECPWLFTRCLFLFEFFQGTDQSFLEKCHFTHTSNTLYDKPRMSAPEFSIKHYAGKVTYNVRNFLDKNRDTLRADVVQLLIQSKNRVSVCKDLNFPVTFIWKMMSWFYTCVELYNFTCVKMYNFTCIRCVISHLILVHSEWA
jgi:hypothetical protein